MSVWAAELPSVRHGCVIRGKRSPHARTLVFNLPRRELLQRNLHGLDDKQGRRKRQVVPHAPWGICTDDDQGNDDDDDGLDGDDKNHDHNDDVNEDNDDDDYDKDDKTTTMTTRTTTANGGGQFKKANMAWSHKSGERAS